MYQLTSSISEDTKRQYQDIIDKFISGILKLSFCHDSNLQHNVIFEKLVEPWEHDRKVEVILHIMLPAMARLLQHIFSDHLEGGKWQEVSPDVRERIRGLPKHNKFSESVFGHLDKLLKQKPNITTVASEAYIMFSHNNTLKWLASKSATEKAQILHAARKSTRHVRKQFKERQLEIQAARRGGVLHKLGEAEEIKRRCIQKLEQYTLDIMYWGLWEGEHEVDEYLASLQSKSDKLKSL